MDELVKAATGLCYVSIGTLYVLCALMGIWIAKQFIKK